MIIMIGPSLKSRGGITSVVKEIIKKNKFQIKYISSYDDRNVFNKILFFLSSIFIFLFYSPGCKIVHIHTPFGLPSSVRKFIFFLMAKFFNKKIIIHIHTTNKSSIFETPPFGIALRMLKNCDKIIVISPYWKRILTPLDIDQKITTLYNPCKSVKPFERVENNYILYAGKLNKRKGYLDLLKSVALLKKDNIKFKLFFAGNGDLEKANSEKNKLKLNEDVIICGWRSGSDLDELFKKCSVFCLPSYAEGLPMAVLDAYSYDMCVLSTNVGGLKDILIDNKNALVFNPGDVNSMYLKLKKILSDKKLRERLRKRGSELAKTLSSKKYNINLANIYSDILK